MGKQHISCKWKRKYIERVALIKVLVVCSLSVPSGFGKISNSFSEDFQLNCTIYNKYRWTRLLFSFWKIFTLNLSNISRTSFGFPTFQLGTLASFFSPLVFCFYVFDTFVFIFIALNFYAVFPFTKKQSASHRKIKQHSAFRLPTARDDPNFNFHFDFHFHFGSKRPRWLRVGWGDASVYTIYDILCKEYIYI